MTYNNNQRSPVIELAPELLSIPFRVQTDWHVITGAPCSGKTTLIKLLSEKGFQIIPEVGRMYVEREIARGRTLYEIRANTFVFNNIVKDMQLEIEHGLQPANICFLDRAFPDSLAYFQLAGMNPNVILPECFRHRYASVFVLDRFPVQKDAARSEDDISADFLDQWLTRDYNALGYEAVRVPVLPPEERLMFIIERLSGYKTRKQPDDDLPCSSPG